MDGPEDCLVLTQINLFLIKTAEKGDYWIFHVDRLLKKLGFSGAEKLLKQQLPSKASWKKVVKERTLELQEEKFKAEKKSLELFFPADYKLNGKLSKLIIFQKTPCEVATMRINVRLLIEDYPTNVNLNRTRRIYYNHCDYCENIYSVFSTNTNLHALVTCPLISDNDNLSHQLAASVNYQI